MSAVEVDSLDMRYGDVVAVRGLSFVAGAGAVTCVLGRNGAGKTSTIEALEGLRRPDGGRLSVLGFDPQRDLAALVLRVGVMLQEVGLPPSVRVGELARCTADLYPAAVDVSSLLERLDLARLERRTIRQLSGGEQRRLAMALALVGRPQVVFLDEPTAGVDADGREVIRQIIGELRDEGVAVLLTTHDLGEAERVADQFVVIESGRLRAQGTLDDLRAWGGGEPDIRFRAPPGLDTLGLANHLGGWHTAPVTEIGWGEYRVAAHPTPALIAALTSWLDYYGLPLADLRTGHATLEDLFLELTTPDDAPPELLEPGRSPGTGRRPLTGYGIAGGRATTRRPTTTGEHPTVTGHPTTGEHPVTATAHHAAPAARPTTGEQPIVGGHPGVAGEQPIAGRRPITAQQPTLARRRYATGEHPIVTGEHQGMSGGRYTTGQHPIVTGEQPLTAGWRPDTDRRPSTGEHPATPGGRYVTGQHPIVTGDPPGAGGGRLGGDHRAVTGEHPTMPGGQPRDDRRPVTGEHRGMSGGRYTTGQHPIVTGEQPLTAGWRPDTDRRPSTGEHPATPGGRYATGQHPIVTGEQPGMPAGRPGGSERAVAGERPVVAGGRYATGQHPIVAGEPPGAGGGRLGGDRRAVTGEHPTMPGGRPRDDRRPVTGEHQGMSGGRAGGSGRGGAGRAEAGRRAGGEVPGMGGGRVPLTGRRRLLRGRLGKGDRTAGMPEAEARAETAPEPARTPEPAAAQSRYPNVMFRD